MAQKVNHLAEYVRKTLGVPAEVHSWTDTNRFPPFIRHAYEFAELRGIGAPCLLFLDRSREEQSPIAVRKHLDLLRAFSELEPVYVRERMTPYNRKRLIEQQIPYIVPGSQLYLPMRAIDLRERFRAPRETRRRLRPAAQALLLDWLLRRDPEQSIAAHELTGRLGYTAMTLSRAFDEIEDAGLGETATIGRERRLQLVAPRKALWDLAQPVLSTPVSGRKFIQSIDLLPDMRAGLSALAAYSMLAPPPYPVVAMSAVNWSTFQLKHQIFPVPYMDRGAVEVEIWSYPPERFAVAGLVDRLSLYLSLKEEKDERIETSLGEMMEAISW